MGLGRPKNKIFCIFTWLTVEPLLTNLIHNISIQYDVEPLRMGSIQFGSLILHIINKKRAWQLLHLPQIIWKRNNVILKRFRLLNNSLAALSLSFRFW